jgi:hypothetical protein
MDELNIIIKRNKPDSERRVSHFFLSFVESRLLKDMKVEEEES